MQFDCCGVEDDGYKAYIHNDNASNSDPFPASCCVSNPANGTCPKTVKDAKNANPAVFKKKVRKHAVALHFLVR